MIHTNQNEPLILTQLVSWVMNFPFFIFCNYTRICNTTDTSNEFILINLSTQHWNIVSIIYFYNLYISTSFYAYRKSLTLTKTALIYLLYLTILINFIRNLCLYKEAYIYIYMFLCSWLVWVNQIQSNLLYNFIIIPMLVEFITCVICCVLFFSCYYGHINILHFVCQIKLNIIHHLLLVTTATNHPYPSQHNIHSIKHGITYVFYFQLITW